MEFLTDFADQAVVLPVAGVILLWLGVSGWWRGALAWAACVSGVLSVVLALKLVGSTCGTMLGWRAIGLVSPSGHTASACVVYGGVLCMLAPRTRLGAWAALAGPIAASVLIGVSRLELHLHTRCEVVVGGLVGVVGAILMRRMAGPLPVRRPQHWLFGAAVLAMIAFHGRRMKVETDLQWMALRYWPLSVCVADR